MQESDLWGWLFSQDPMPQAAANPRSFLLPALGYGRGTDVPSSDNVACAQSLVLAMAFGVQVVVLLLSQLTQSHTAVSPTDLGSREKPRALTHSPVPGRLGTAPGGWRGLGALASLRMLGSQKEPWYRNLWPEAEAKVLSNSGGPGRPRSCTSYVKRGEWIRQVLRFLPTPIP